MQRAGAAVRDEGEIARVVAALDRHDAQRAQHLCVHDLDDRGRIDPVERGCGCIAVEDEAARQLLRQPVEQEVRVRHGRAAAAAVARRTRIGARRLGPDAKRAARILPHERAAAGADRVHVHRRQPNRQPADPTLGDARGTAARQEADVGGGAPHVERDGVLEARPARQEACADDAAGRA